MANLDLRPLSLGEILDRTFSLYRRNFLLFIGITAIPQLLILAMNLAGTLLSAAPALPRLPRPEQFQGRAATGFLALGVGGAIVGLIVYFVAYLFAQGGTVYAVSDIYLGRRTSIGESLGRMKGQLGSLFGVLLLNGLVIMGATLFLIIPGIYMACRLLTCVPAALLEDLGPRASLERSFRLTKDYAGRAFVIYFLYAILFYGITILLALPLGFGIVAAAKDPSALRILTALTHVVDFLAAVLISPILTIGTAVFYYDLRVRKEAFDLQMMMNPGGSIPAGRSSVPTMLS